MSNSEARTIYFDITDIIHFATAHSTVTGIQRVQINIIFNIARNNKNNSILCTFFHPDTKKLIAFNPLDILSDQEEFDAQPMLYRLGLLKPGRRIPTKREIKKYLNARHKSKLTRALKKLEIYFTAVFYKQHLEAIGLRIDDRRLRNLELARVQEIQLNRNDIYAILGSNWSFKGVIEICKAHSLRGGVVMQMIYDLIPQTSPEFFTKALSTDFKKWLHDVASYVDRFICISQYTADDLRRFLGANATHKAIDVVPLAHEFSGYPRISPAPVPRSAISDIIKNPFVLCVGTIEIRKNGAALLKVWLRLIEILGEKTPSLVFAGRRGWLVDNFETILKDNKVLRNFVKITESPSDFDLVALYKNCLFTVYPSLYEGWGLPVGESVWFGKFCLASSTTSVPEVCGDLIDYVDPTDLDDMTAKIKHLIQNPLYIQSRESVIQNSKLRTWQDVSSDLLDFIVK